MTKLEYDGLVGGARFSIKRNLGVGSFGVVYQAYDHERRATVAIKTLKRVSSEGLIRFKREFRALADVRHPNLVSLYELLSDGEQWFYTMELIRGVDFLEYVWGGTVDTLDKSLPDYNTPTLEPLEHRRLTRSTTPSVENESSETMTVAGPSDITIGPPVKQLTRTFELREDRLRRAMCHLAEGLHALHALGQLHRDVKPSNVLVTKNGTLKLLDFGLVTEHSPNYLEQSLDVVGTPAYMSPEQGAKKRVTEASDWYSAGVMLYESLTGRYPFDGSFIEVLWNKQIAQPQPPSHWADRVPADLELLCMDLLRTEPDTRPKGREIVQRTRQMVAQNEHPLYSSFTLRRSSTGLVGRALHLSQLADAFRVVKSGRPAVVRVIGRSGMGKTALVRWFLKQLRTREPDTTILVGRCYAQESVPYKALDSLIDVLARFLKRLLARELDAITPKDVIPLARLFPVLAPVLGVTSADLGANAFGSLETRRRAFKALRDLMLGLSSRRPVILFLDDVHWGDADSAALLKELLRPPNAPPFLVLVTHRNEENYLRSPVVSMLQRLRERDDGPLLSELVVGELTFVEASELARALLRGKETDDSGRADAIARDCGGSPFFIDELVRYASDHEFDALSESGRLIAVNDAEPSLDYVLQQRVEQLPDYAQRLLQVVAVAGQPLDREVAYEAADIEASDFDSLTILRSARLLRAAALGAKNEIETFHDRVREAVLSALTGDEIKHRHARLAKTLERRSGTDPETLARHFHAAGYQSRAARYALLAGELAKEALAFTRAAQLFELAIDLKQNQNATAELFIKWAEALASAGRGAESARAYLGAAERAHRDRTIDLKRCAVEQFLVSGHVEEASETLTEVLDELDLTYPKTPRRALLSVVRDRIRIALRGLEFKSQTADQLDPKTLLRIDTCWSMAKGLGNVDTVRAAVFQGRGLLHALDGGDPYRVVRALGFELVTRSYPGGNSRAKLRRLAASTMALATKVGNPHGVAWTTFTRGISAFLFGEWREANSLVVQAGKRFREGCRSVTWELDNCDLFRLMSHFWLGDWHILRRDGPEIVAEAERRGDRYLATTLRTVILYVVALADDAPERAGTDMSQIGFSTAYSQQHYFDLCNRVDIDLYCGDATKAWHQIDEEWLTVKRALVLRAQLARIDTFHRRGRAALGAALHCTAAGEKRKLLRHAHRDAKRVRRERKAYGQPMAALLDAGIRSMTGDVEAALEHLLQAEVGFEAADMGFYRACAMYRRGQILGGDEGQTVYEEAEAWMQQHGIMNSKRMLRAFAPGKFEGT